jgi:WD40 repeat protein
MLKSRKNLNLKNNVQRRKVLGEESWKTNLIYWKMETVIQTSQKTKNFGEHNTGITPAVIAVIAIPPLTLKKPTFLESTFCIITMLKKYYIFYETFNVFSDGQYILAGSDDGCFFIWDRNTGIVERVLRGDESIVNCLQPHPFTCMLASSGIDSVVRIWSPLPQVPICYFNNLPTLLNIV